MRPFFFVILFLASSLSAAEFPLPEFATAELPNGLRLYVAENRYQATVTLRAVVAAGDRYDIPKIGDEHLLVARGLRRGIPGLESTALDGQIAKLGAVFSSWNDHDVIWLTADVIEKNWREALRIFSAMLINPTFPKQGISLLKKQRIIERKAELEQPGALGMVYFLDALYGWGYAPCDGERAVAGVSREDVVRFHTKYFRPDRASIVAIGDFNASDAIAALREAFEKWPSGKETIEPAKPRTPVANPPKMRLIHKSGLTQATILWGRHSISYADTGRYALSVANWVLGGSGFSSRLTSHLRIEGGRTYHIGSYHQGSSDDGQYLLSISTRNDGLAATIDTIRAVTEEFVRDGMTREEYEEARSGILGSFPLRYETPSQVAGNLAGLLSIGLSLADWRSNYSRYEAVTFEEAIHVASEQIQPEKMIWVVVGDKDKVGEQLRKEFGNFQTVHYKGGAPRGSFLKRTRLGLGGTWNSAARGPRVSLLNRRVILSGTYGLERSNDTWDYRQAWQVDLDLHRRDSEYSMGSLFIGAIGTSAGDVKGISPHVGVRIFPYAIRYHYSLSTEIGWSLWDKGDSDKDLPGFYWSTGIDYFF